MITSVDIVSQLLVLLLLLALHPTHLGTLPVFIICLLGLHPMLLSLLLRLLLLLDLLHPLLHSTLLSHAVVTSSTRLLSRPGLLLLLLLLQPSALTHSCSTQRPSCGASVLQLGVKPILLTVLLLLQLDLSTLLPVLLLLQLSLCSLLLLLLLLSGPVMLQATEHALCAM